MKLIITMELDAECADPDHESGIAEEANEQLFEALMQFGTDIRTEVVN